MGANEAAAQVVEAASKFESRTWTDDSQRFTRLGSLVAANQDHVLLRLRSGRYALIARNRLCEADQAWLRDVDHSDEEPTHLADAPERSMRTWSNRAGRATTEAAIVALIGDELVVQRPNGELASAMLERLSAEDQEYARATTARHRTRRKTPSTVKVASWQEPVAAAKSAEFIPDGASLSAPRRVVYVRAGREYLQSLLKDEAGIPKPFVDIIGGTPVRGTSSTNGHATITFVPSSQQAIVDLQFTGTNVATSIGFLRRAALTSRSQTWFQANQRSVLDESGVISQPATCTGCATSELLGVDASARGLFAAFIRRRVARDFASRSGAHNAETAQHVSRGVAQGIDQQTNASLTPINGAIKELFASLSGAGLDLGIQSGTTADQLHAVVYKRQVAENPAEAAPPELPDKPAVAIWIHGSLIHQFTTDANLQAVIQPLIAKLGQPADDGQPAPTTDVPGYAVGWTRDGSWMTVSIRLGSSPTASVATPDSAEVPPMRVAGQ